MFNPIFKWRSRHPAPQVHWQSRAASGLTQPGLLPRFRALSGRLLLSYMGAMATVTAVSTIAVYQFVAYRLYEDLDHELFSLAHAAAHNLADVESAPAALQHRLPRSIDNDGDLDIPWQDLREADQTVEWFGQNRQRLGSAGNGIPQMPLNPSTKPQQQNGLRLITLTVPKPDAAHTKPAGYVRVSEPTQSVEAELQRLLTGLGLGSTIAILLSGGTGWWLTRRSLRPIAESIQQLQQFTADASHELRNPLTAIQTAVEVMQSHPERIHPADVQKLAAIASATQQMTRLVQDLLLLARSDSHSSLTAAMRIPLDELVEDLLVALKPQAIAQAVSLEAASFNEVWVNGDANQLRRLFANLLDNALQYTPTGGTVQVALYPQDVWVVVTVQDTGIGIAADQLAQVFNRFWRADQARSHRAGGAGLGLAIAQAIAQHHGGEITVKSEVGVGSCFRVRLPIAA